eukprot:14274953-Ditylum_brightwellii.AAC.1
MVVEDRGGSESLYDLLPEQGKDNDDDNNSTYLTNKTDPQDEDDTSLSYISSLQDAQICHETDNFEPTDITITTETTNEDTPPSKNDMNDNNSEDTLPDKNDMIDNNVMTHIYHDNGSDAE